MSGIASYWRNAGHLLVAAFVAGCALTACDSAIYDDEGDCSVTYRLEPAYRKNMKWADAFSSEVSSVHLYAFDREGLLVGTQSEHIGTPADDYAMTLDLPAGDYRLVAWCGLDGRESKAGETPSFTVPEARIGQTRLEEFCCRLNCTHEADGTAVSDKKLLPLYHGTADVSLPTNDDGGVYDYSLELTKNTNHIRVVLQQLSGDPVDVHDFSFRIEEANGLMKWDNSLAGDETIVYRPHDLTSGSVGLGIDDYPVAGTVNAPKAAPRAADASRAITSVGVAIADFTIGRLMVDRSTWLTVETTKRNADGTPGETVISAHIPLRDYALLLKDGYNHEFADDQDYLDRQDEYTLVFFLDKDYRWIESSIIINSWKYVFNKVDF